jgi:hypothetical protein
MSWCSKDEIRRRALRAAAAVSLSFAAVGCGTEGTLPLADPPAQEADASSSADASAVDAGWLAVDAGTLVDAGSPDAGVGCGLPSAPDYLSCCSASHWSAPGCDPWGPPVPPRWDSRVA